MVWQEAADGGRSGPRGPRPDKPHGANVVSVGIEHRLTPACDEPLQTLVAKAQCARAAQAVVVTLRERDVQRIAPIAAVIIEEADVNVVTPVR